MKLTILGFIIDISMLAALGLDDNSDDCLRNFEGQHMGVFEAAILLAVVTYD
jgi:hypothetical protein